MPLALRWEFAHVHKEDLPGMTIEIFYGTLLHEAIVAHFTNLYTSGCYCVCNYFVYRVSAVDRKGEEASYVAFCVCNRFVCKAFELIVRQYHQEDAIAPYHAFAGIVGELRVVGEAHSCVKAHGLLKVGDCEVDEDLFGHGLCVFVNV